jgi:hypothetical protein
MKNLMIVCVAAVAVLGCGAEEAARRICRGFGIMSVNGIGNDSDNDETHSTAGFARTWLCGDACGHFRHGAA